MLVHEVGEGQRVLLAVVQGYEEVLGVHHVAERLADPREQLLHALGRVNRAPDPVGEPLHVLRSLAFGDVHARAHRADHTAFGIPLEGAVPLEHPLLAGEREDLALVVVQRAGVLVGDQSFEHLSDLLAAPLGNERIEPVPPGDGILGPSQDLAALPVDQRHAPVEVQPEEDHAGQIKVALRLVPSGLKLLLGSAVLGYVDAHPEEALELTVVSDDGSAVPLYEQLFAALRQ